MAFRRKEAVGTALDKEELEDLLKRLDSRLDDLKNSMYEMDKATAKAGRVMSDLKTAMDRAEATGRKRLTHN